MNTLPGEDMRKTHLEHSMVIHNFVIEIGNYPYLYKTVTEINKNDLQLVIFPTFKITFDELFNLE